MSRYLQNTAALGLGWPLPGALDDPTLEARLFRRPAPVRDRARPDCAYIHRELKRDGVTLQLLWKEYPQVHSTGYRYTQFCEIHRQWAKRLRPSMRQVHRAGEKTFVDFSGKRPALVDRRTGERRRVELFIAVLGASSFTYAEATATQQLPDWVDAHIRMVEYFGAATTLWVPDQLRSAVTRLWAAATFVATTVGLLLLACNRAATGTTRLAWALLALLWLTTFVLMLVPDAAPARGLIQRLGEGTLYGTLCVVAWRLPAVKDETRHVSAGAGVA